MELTREQAIKLLIDGDENWDSNVELLYCESTGRYPTIYDVMATFGISQQEIDNLRVRKMENLI